MSIYIDWRLDYHSRRMSFFITWMLTQDYREILILAKYLLFPVFSSANLYTLSWSSSSTVSFKSVSWKIITRVQMKQAKLKPSAQAWFISCNSVHTNIPNIKKFATNKTKIHEIFEFRFRTVLHPSIMNFPNFVIFVWSLSFMHSKP